MQKERSFEKTTSSFVAFDLIKRAWIWPSSYNVGNFRKGGSGRRALESEIGFLSFILLIVEASAGKDENLVAREDSHSGGEGGGRGGREAMETRDVMQSWLIWPFRFALISERSWEAVK